MTKIFLSYRRDDSADIAGRIFDHLERRFGRDRLFLDVDAIRYGDDFRRRIDEALNQTAVLLAIIGDRWLEAADEAHAGTRRLADPNDYVSIEIASALERGITVVPVLVGEARMPSVNDLPARLADLSYRNAAEVRSGRDFFLHIDRLIDAIADLVAVPQSPPSSRKPAPRATRLSTSFRTLEETPERLVGAQLGAFVIERVLAAGGSGIAYIARNPRTSQRVCVKVSLPVLSDMEAIRRALSRGIRGLVALNHPHIVRIHEFDALELADATSFYVAMDYVEGERFDRWSAALPCTDEGRRRFMRAACLMARALEAAHTCRYRDDIGFETVGVMHGDVKPGNIVMRADDTPALLDFMMIDIHRALDPAARERPSVSGDVSTAVFGTPGFMAPEQEQEGIVTVRTDIYGLGATLRAAGVQLSLPDDVHALFERMTGPVERRPHDMGEVANALSGVAHRLDPDTADMRRAGRPPETEVRSGVLSAMASLFKRRTPSTHTNEAAGSASASPNVSSAYPEVPPIFRLRIVAGPDAGSVYALRSIRVTVGRSDHNDLIVAREPSISRSHFALNWSPEQRTFVAVDFGARTPLLINGEPLAGSRALAPGDVLTIGSTQLMFEPAAGNRPTRT